MIKKQSGQFWVECDLCHKNSIKSLRGQMSAIETAVRTGWTIDDKETLCKECARNRVERTTISLSKALFAEFKRLRKKAGYTNEGFIRMMLSAYKHSEVEKKETK